MSKSLVLCAWVVIRIAVGVSESTQYKVTLSNTVRDERSPGQTLGEVSPTDCGGFGTLLRTRISGCEKNTPCRLTFETIIEMDFIASSTSTRATSQYQFFPRNGQEYTRTNNLGEIAGNVAQTLTVTQLDSSFTRQESTIKISIRNDIGHLEVCMMDTFNVLDGQGTTPNPNHATPAISRSVTTMALMAAIFLFSIGGLVQL